MHWTTDPACPTSDVVTEVPALKGLHAKLYVQDHGTRATVWLGSANLTDAAFNTNVDVLVELTGSVYEVGVECVLARKGRKDDLSWLVEPHDLPEADGDADPEEELDPIEHHAYDLASCSFQVLCSEGTGGWTAELAIADWHPEPTITTTRPAPEPATEPLDPSRERASDVDEPCRRGHHAVCRRHVVDRRGNPQRPRESRHSRRPRRPAKVGDRSGNPVARRLHAVPGGVARLRHLWLGRCWWRRRQPASTRGSRASVSTGCWRICSRRRLAILSGSPRSTKRSDALRRDPRFDSIVPHDFTQLWQAVYTSRKAAIG